MGKHSANYDGSRNGRTWVPVWVVLAILAATFVTAFTSSAGAQLSPCDGGRGVCSTAKYVDRIDFTGVATCTWTLTYDWGDGNTDTFTRTVKPPRSTKFVHQYAQPGLYTVMFSGTGSGGSNATCTVAPGTFTVEVVPAGVRVCLGRIATIVGTSGADRIVGTSGADVIAGLGGNDVIDGGAGNDRICGGKGADTLRGGAGLDAIEGGRGRDVLRGGSESDLLDGGSGKDRLFGGGGNDFLFGRSGNDRLIGGKGKDDLRGGSGNDRLRGNKGRDSLNGGPGTDNCKGGPAKDTVRACER